MTSHCDGEVWGLEVVTLDDGSLRILTSADDNRILAYNGKTHQALCEGKIAEPGKKKHQSQKEEEHQLCLACQKKVNLDVLHTMLHLSN